MKGREAHSKPLPRQAVEILKQLFAVTGPQGFVFPAIGKAGRPLSENTMSVGLEAAGIQSSEHVPHGFRASASTMLNDSAKFTADAVERELSHKDEDQVRRAYRRSEAMAERIAMAQWWADHLDALRSPNKQAGNVVPLRR
jgi:integrase